MIEEIRIENIGVIGSATVPLGPGLTAITGETGAGKTMVLTGLALILGGRADAALVRTGASHASAEGCFVVDPRPAAKTWLPQPASPPEPESFASLSLADELTCQSEVLRPFATSVVTGT